MRARSPQAPGRLSGHDLSMRSSAARVPDCVKAAAATDQKRYKGRMADGYRGEWLLILMVGACTGEPGVPTPAPTSPSAALPSAALPSAASPAAASAADSTSSASSTAAAASGTRPDRALPPHHDRCETDADCAVIHLHLEGKYACCHGCGTTTAGTSGWVAAVQRACRARVPSPNCYPLSCPAGPQHGGCVAGRCRALVFPPGDPRNRP